MMPAVKVERDRVQKELREIENDIDSTFMLFKEMGGGSSSVTLVREKLEKLGERKKKLTAYRDD